MPLYDPNNPLYAGPGDLTDIIDRFAEGDISGRAGEYDDPYQGAAERFASNASHEASGTQYTNPANVFNPDGSITGRATEFATPRDLAVYRAGGGLKYGDNGVGYFGQKTTGGVPYVAISRDLLRQKYKHEDAAKGKFVEVTAPNGRTAVVEIGDVGPRIKSPRQPLIELNPAAKAVLGSGDANGYTYRLLD